MVRHDTQLLFCSHRKVEKTWLTVNRVTRRVESNDNDRDASTTSFHSHLATLLAGARKAKRVPNAVHATDATSFLASLCTVQFTQKDDSSCSSIRPISTSLGTRDCLAKHMNKESVLPVSCRTSY